MSGRRGDVLLVTGATGYLGSHFIQDRLQAGASVYGLGRSKRGTPVDLRLPVALERAQFVTNKTSQATDQLHPVEGDILLPLCGVDAGEIARLHAAGIGDFWHFASDLRFEEGYRDEIWRGNVQGARHALDLALAIGAQRFVYVSTAYTAGKAVGTIAETLHPIAGPFNNIYEQSKCQAEHMLTAECRRRGISLTIVRPAIVVGPRGAYRPDGSMTGLYGFVCAILQLSALLAGRRETIRVAANPDAEVNFVPVDCVIADMAELIEKGLTDGAIHHLTSARSVNVGQCWAAVSAATTLRGVTLQPHVVDKPSSLERLVARRVDFFLGYVMESKRFARSLPSLWEVGPLELEAYVAAACRVAARSRGSM